NSVQDVQKSLNDVIADPCLMAHVMKMHERLTQSIHETAELSGRKKRKRPAVDEFAQENSDVLALRRGLEAVRLKCWPLTLRSALFIRPPKQSDHNTLQATKCLSLPAIVSDPCEALVFVTVYDRLTWGHKLLSRSSQHVLLSSHSLGDLFDVIPCSSNEIPEPPAPSSNETWGEASARGSSGSVICLEGVAYGDGQSEKDYSECKAAALQKGLPMHEVTFRSLQIRLHHPYWLCHAGNCDHFFVIELLRAHHPSDPPVFSFPLTTQITPRLLENCRACNKVPAVYAINGDVRLGETPFVVCAPCWRWMGPPKPENADKVQVVPLPKHEFGWHG
ncbi:uncharacterized protein PHACADRAFT_96477, partial [Phanerochaete carnosa HHB-10118-sp]